MATLLSPQSDAPQHETSQDSIDLPQSLLIRRVLDLFEAASADAPGSSAISDESVITFAEGKAAPNETLPLLEALRTAYASDDSAFLSNIGKLDAGTLYAILDQAVPHRADALRRTIRAKSAELPNPTPFLQHVLTSLVQDVAIDLETAARNRAPNRRKENRAGTAAKDLENETKKRDHEARHLGRLGLSSAQIDDLLRTTQLSPKVGDDAEAKRWEPRPRDDLSHGSSRKKPQAENAPLISSSNGARDAAVRGRTKAAPLTSGETQPLPRQDADQGAASASSSQDRDERARQISRERAERPLPTLQEADLQSDADAFLQDSSIAKLRALITKRQVSRVEVERTLKEAQARGGADALLQSFGITELQAFVEAIMPPEATLLRESIANAVAEAIDPPAVLRAVLGDILSDRPISFDRSAAAPGQASSSLHFDPPNKRAAATEWYPQSLITLLVLLGLPDEEIVGLLGSSEVQVPVQNQPDLAAQGAITGRAEPSSQAASLSADIQEEEIIAAVSKRNPDDDRLSRDAVVALATALRLTLERHRAGAPPDLATSVSREGDASVRTDTPIRESGQTAGQLSDRRKDAILLIATAIQTAFEQHIAGAASDNESEYGQGLGEATSLSNNPDERTGATERISMSEPAPQPPSSTSKPPEPSDNRLGDVMTPLVETALGPAGAYWLAALDLVWLALPQQYAFAPIIQRRVGDGVEIAGDLDAGPHQSTRSTQSAPQTEVPIVPMRDIPQDSPRHRPRYWQEILRKTFAPEDQSLTLADSLVHVLRVQWNRAVDIRVWNF
ncbi:MAG: hypothetical protein AAF330_06615, partial [Pseudomonadota bacterium]